MEKTFKVDKITKTESSDGIEEKYTLIPADELSKKCLKLTVKTELMAESIGIPTSIDDTVIIDFGKTNKQQKIIRQPDPGITNIDKNKKKEKIKAQQLPTKIN